MKKTINLITLIFLSIVAVGQNSQPKELHFNRLFVKDGLPEGQVNSLVQDKEGYMWIGTQKGLVRYDGYSPKLYNFGIEDPSKMGIWNIYLDRADRLWAGGSGLYLYDRTEDRFIYFNPNSSASDSLSSPILDIHDDQYGHLWLLFYDRIKKKRQLEHFDPASKSFIKYGIKEKGTHYINAKQVYNLFEDTKGTIWVGSDNGIYQYNNKTDHFDSHLAIADSTKQNTFHLYSEVHQPYILWMAASESKPPNKGEGLWRYDTRTNTVTVFRHRTADSSSIASDNIHGIITDSLRRMWISTDKGLSLFVPAKNNFINYFLKDNNTGELISLSEIEEDKNENFWLGTNKGLVFFNTQTRVFTRYPAHEKDPYGLAGNRVHNLLLDHSGTLWFGANQIGLQWINKPHTRFVQYKDDPGQLHHFPGGGVNSFAEAKDSTIWLGSAHGLYHWQPHTDSFTLVKIKKNQEKDFYVRDIVINKEGLVWCGVTSDLSQGLYCYDPKTGKTRYFSNNKKDIK